MANQPPHCSRCNQLLIQVGKFWVCPEHGPTSPDKPLAPLRIFLSYGHDGNEELVRIIKADLEKRGHDVWFDKSEIKFGDDWRRTITEGILGSHRVVSFLSKHSTRDPGVCRDEIAIAIGVKGGNIQTVLVESEQDVQPPVDIGHIQWLDMHDWKEHRHAGEAAWEQWYQAKLAEIVRVVESEESRRFAGEIETLNGYLKPIKSDARICQLLSKGFYGRQWLFEAVEKWRKDANRDSRLFWIMGAPGVGKSAFSAQLTHTRGDTVIAAQFCEWDKPDHRNAPRVVRSLAFQLATRLPDYRKLLLALPEIAELDRKDAAELFDYLLANPLRSVISGGRQRYLIVIDALDESGEAGRNPLVEMLARNAKRLPGWLGLVVTSRPEFDVKTPLQALNPFAIDTRSELNRADIRDYLRRELASPLQNRPDADRLVEQILENSEGVFLYVERFCDDVRHGHLSLDRPGQFPQGLGGVFADYFKRQFPDLEKFHKNARPALRTILAAREPLPVEVLQRVLRWQDEELRDFTRPLASLFPVTTERGHEVIKPYHKALSDWLADQSQAGAYFVSVMEGHRTLAEAGWTAYLRSALDAGSYLRTHLAWHLAEAEFFDRLLDALADGSLRLFHEWVDGGHTADGRFCLQRLLTVADRRLVSGDVRVALATQLARIEMRQGDLHAADALLRESLPAVASGTPPRIVAIANHEFGSVLFELGKTREARTWYRRSLRIARKESPPLLKEIASNLLGIAMTYHIANPSCSRIGKLALYALRCSRESADVAHELEALRLLADVSKDRMEYPLAEEYLSAGLRKASDGKLPFTTMALLTVQGWMGYQRAAMTDMRTEDALRPFRELLELATRQGHRRYQVDAWCGIGQCALVAGDVALARQAVHWLSELPKDSMFKHGQVRCSLLAASLLHREREYENALAAFREGLALATEAAIWAREADAHVGSGAAMYYLGDVAGARLHWTEAVAISERCPRIRRNLVARSIDLVQHDPTAIPL